MNWIAWFIIACEIGFWVFIIAGLFARYVFKQQKLGIYLLAMSPIVDLVLLIATSFDLYRGATTTIAHGVAAVYIGVSIAFGKSMIRWADERFQYYVAKTGPKPVKRYGLDYAKHYFKGWIRHVLSYMIGCGMIGMIDWLIDDIERTAALVQIAKVWTIVLIVDFLISISYFIFPRKKPEEG
jgi:hypothetical protein